MEWMQCCCIQFSEPDRWIDPLEILFSPDWNLLENLIPVFLDIAVRQRFPTKCNELEQFWRQTMDLYCPKSCAKLVESYSKLFTHSCNGCQRCFHQVLTQGGGELSNYDIWWWGALREVVLLYPLSRFQNLTPKNLAASQRLSNFLFQGLQTISL